MILEPFAKGFEMLLCQDSCRHEDRYLLAFRYCLERCSYRYFCFPVTNITTKLTIHSPFSFHFLCDFFNTTQLIFCCLIREGTFESLLHFLIFRKSIPFLCLSFCI